MHQNRLILELRPDPTDVLTALSKIDSLDLRGLYYF